MNLDRLSIKRNTVFYTVPLCVSSEEFFFTVVHLIEQIHLTEIAFRSLKICSFSILVLFNYIAFDILLVWASFNSFHRKFFFTKIEKKNLQGNYSNFLLYITHEHTLCLETTLFKRYNLFFPSYSSLC